MSRKNRRFITGIFVIGIALLAFTLLPSKKDSTINYKGDLAKLVRDNCGQNTQTWQYWTEDGKISQVSYLVEDSSCMKVLNSEKIVKNVFGKKAETNFTGGTFNIVNPDGIPANVVVSSGKVYLGNSVPEFQVAFKEACHPYLPSKDAGMPVPGSVMISVDLERVGQMSLYRSDECFAALKNAQMFTKIGVSGYVLQKNLVKDDIVLLSWPDGIPAEFFHGDADFERAFADIKAAHDKGIGPDGGPLQPQAPADSPSQHQI